MTSASGSVWGVSVDMSDPMVWIVTSGRIAAAVGDILWREREKGVCVFCVREEMKRGGKQVMK